MIWNQSLKTGLNLIDDQHYEIFGFFDVLLSLVDPEQIKLALVNLHESLKKSFKYEQQLQQESAYPDRMMHKYHHNNFIYTLRRLQQEYFEKNISQEIFVKQSQRMAEWLIDHIQTHDVSFVKFYKEHAE